MSWKTWRLTLTALTALTVAPAYAPLHAAEPDAAAGAPAEAPIYLDRMTVTATRNPIPAFDAPGMVTVIERDEIDLLQPSTPDDILRFVPGVEFVGGPRRTGESPSIRGFSGPDVVILFDGARQNFNSAHDGRFFIDPALISSVEALRGASSSLYGSGGTGGVIEFRTVRAADFLAPGETAGGRVAAGYQDANKEEFGSLTGYSQAGGVDVIANVSYRDSDTIRLGDGSKLRNSDDQIASGLFKIGGAIHEDHYLEAAYQGFFGDVEEPNNGQGLGGPDAVDKDISGQTFRLAYNYDNPDDRLFGVDAVAYYTLTKADEQRLDNLGAGPAGEVLTRDVQTFGFRLDNRSTVELAPTAQTRFTYGVEYYRDEQDGEAGGAARDGVPNAEADSFGAFLQAEVMLDDLGPVPGELSITPGGRFDYYRIESEIVSGDENKSSEFSPRIAAVYKPVPWLMGFASYAHAFRAPTFDEMFLTGVHFQIPIGPGVNNFFTPNPDLKPQRTRTFEFGGGVEFDHVVEPGDRLQAKASYHMTDGRDFIALDVVQPEPFIDCNPFIPGNCNGSTTSRNVPKAELHGFEAEAGYESSRFKVTLGYSTIDAEDKETGEQIGLLAPDQLTAGFAVKVHEIDAIVGWRGIFARSFTNPDDPSEDRDGYDVHDFYVAYAPSDGPLAGFRVDLGVDNAFDEAYSRTFTDANEQGRNYKAMVSYAYNF